MYPAMNNTKWEELRLAMLNARGHSPRWRTRDVETGYLSPWGGDWLHHFRQGGYSNIEWVEIAAQDAEQLATIQAALARIHVPGERTEFGFRVYGYAPAGKGVDYLPPPDSGS